MRVRIDLRYDGTAFHGWACQPGLRTVQGVLESTIAQVLRTGDPVPTVVAGRTDAGVHARGQVVHADIPDDLPRCPQPPLDALSRWLPAALPEDVSITAITPAPDGFDARFSALNRRYVYRLWDDPMSIDPLTRCFTVATHHRLDLDAMRRGAELLIGLHNFVAFCRPREGATTIRNLLRLDPQRLPSDLIEITVSADAFCHSMVRSLTGALVALGRGQRDLDWMASHLSASRRATDIVVMPAHGLTLEEVVYPLDEELAIRAAQAKSRRDQECDCV